MATEKEIADSFEHIAAEIPGFIAASLVDMDSGMTLAVRSNRSDFDLAVASAYNSELVKQKLKIMTLGLKTTLEDMILHPGGPDPLHQDHLTDGLRLPRGGPRAREHRHRAHRRAEAQQGQCRGDRLCGARTAPRSGAGPWR